MDIAKKIKFYKTKLAEISENEDTTQSKKEELDNIFQATEEIDITLKDYNDLYVRRLCKQITALGNGKIEIEFNFGGKSVQEIK